jgi:hypothetical protein
MDRVRVVEDRSTETAQLSPTSREGTQVFSDAAQAAKESILPLEGALAYALSRSLFPFPFQLLVEGVHDFLYLRMMSDLFARTGRKGLDPRWTIAPMGGSTNIPLFVTMAGTEPRREQVFLLDSRSDLPGTLTREKNLHTYDEFTEGEEAGIEDLFDEDFYLTLVNAVYADGLNRPLSRKNLSGHGRGIAAQVSDIIQSVLRDSDAQFDRLQPAEYFTAHNAELQDSLSQETQLRFAKLFETLNSILL